LVYIVSHISMFTLVCFLHIFLSKHSYWSVSILGPIADIFHAQICYGNFTFWIKCHYHVLL